MEKSTEMVESWFGMAAKDPCHIKYLPRTETTRDTLGSPLEACSRARAIAIMRENA